jgi:kumamolisin
MRCNYLRDASMSAVLLLLVVATAYGQANPPAPPRKIFANSVAPLPSTGGLVVQTVGPPPNPEATMKLLFSLSLPAEAQADLQKRIDAGDIISSKEYVEKYSAPQKGYDDLVKWLKDNHFEVTQTSPDRTSVYAHGTIGDIEKALDVSIVKVTTKGITYNAAKNAPSLPSEIGAAVHGIIGLQPFRKANKHAIRLRSLQNHSGAARTLHVGEPAATPAIAAAKVPPFMVKHILAAYNADDIGVTGSGQVIAILIDTFPDPEDLKRFWHANGLAVDMSHVTNVKVGDTLPAREGEETLDVEWSSGIAPGAQIRVYSCGSLQFTDLDQGLDRILADLDGLPGMHQLSISLGLGETYMLPAEVSVQSAKFAALVAQGVNVFISSGDAGATPDDTGHSSDGPVQVEYESSDPNAVGVGGTSLFLKPDNSVASEIGWTSGGGGKSRLFSRPAWQTGPGIVAGAERLVPDVSAVADPNTGGYVFYQGQPQEYGGTSWSAPTWAGLCALINEARAKAHKPSLPKLHPVIYPLGSTCFRDIIAGNNGVYDAGVGYDLVTGLGVPNVKALIAELTK